VGTLYLLAIQSNLQCLCELSKSKFVDYFNALFLEKTNGDTRLLKEVLGFNLLVKFYGLNYTRVFGNSGPELILFKHIFLKPI